jgi:hypothetical protein
MLPDLDHLKGVDWANIDRKDPEYLKVGITKIIRAAEEAKSTHP